MKTLACEPRPVRVEIDREVLERLLVSGQLCVCDLHCDDCMTRDYLRHTLLKLLAGRLRRPQ